MNRIKTFENFRSESISEDIFNELSHKDKIKYLVDNFSMEKAEAMEICPSDDIKVKDLPNEIRDYFNKNTNEGKLYKATKKEHAKHDWDLDKSKEMREKVEVYLKSLKCKTKQIGSDLEVYFEDEYIAQVMFRKEFVAIKKDGAKFPKEFKYIEFGKIKSELKDLI